MTRGSDTYGGAGRCLFRFFSQEGQHQLHLVLLLLADVVGVCGGKELVQSADVFRGNGGSPVAAEPDSKLKHGQPTGASAHDMKRKAFRGISSNKTGDQRP